jgi:hypothetical protein
MNTPILLHQGRTAGLLADIISSPRRAGWPIGETHHRAKLTNHDVELIQALRDAGLSYGVIARKFDCSKTQVAYICTGKRRGTVTPKVMPKATR